MGRKGKLVRTNKARTLSETGKQVSGPKHYYTLKRNNSIVHLRTKSINVITKQSSSRGPQNMASTSRQEDSDFTTLYKKAKDHTLKIYQYTQFQRNQQDTLTVNFYKSFKNWLMIEKQQIFH